MTKQVGTWAYQSPQQKNKDKVYTSKTDAFSLGAILFMMLNGIKGDYEQSPLEMGVVDPDTLELDKKQLQKVLKKINVSV